MLNFKNQNPKHLYIKMAPFMANSFAQYVAIRLIWKKRTNPIFVCDKILAISQCESTQVI